MTEMTVVIKSDPNECGVSRYDACREIEKWRKIVKSVMIQRSIVAIMSYQRERSGHSWPKKGSKSYSCGRIVV